MTNEINLNAMNARNKVYLVDFIAQLPTQRFKYDTFSSEIKQLIATNYLEIINAELGYVVLSPTARLNEVISAWDIEALRNEIAREDSVYQNMDSSDFGCI